MFSWIKNIFQKMFSRIKNIFQKTPAEKLRIAARDGKTSTVTGLLATSLNAAQVNHPNRNGCTALILSAENGHIDIVMALLAAPGINVNHPNHKGNTALHWAAGNGHIEVVRALLATDLSTEQVNHPNCNGCTALILSAENGHIDIVMALLAAPGINVNLASVSGNDTALILAAQNGHTEIVKALLAIPSINVNLACNSSCSALTLAALNGYTGIVKALLAAPGINVNLASSLGNTALILAAENGHIDIVRALLRAGLSTEQVNHQNEYGNTALIQAAYHGHIDIVRALLARGLNAAQVNHPSQYRYTALIRATENGHIDIVRDLLTASGINVNLACYLGNSALILAAQNGRAEIARALLDVPGIDVNHACHSGATALIIAAQNGHTEIVRALLDVPGIDVNLARQNGNTALSVAKRKGHQVIQHMLQLHTFPEITHQTDSVVVYDTLASANHINQSVVQPVLTLFLCLYHLQHTRHEIYAAPDIALSILCMMEPTNGWMTNHQSMTSKWGPTIGFIQHDYLMNTARKVRANAILGGHLNDSNQADSHGKQACQNTIACGNGPKMIVRLIDAITADTPNRHGQLKSLNIMLDIYPATWKHELWDRLSESGQKENLVTIAATLPQSRTSFFKHDPYPHITAFVRDYVQPKTTSSLKSKHRHMG